MSNDDTTCETPTASKVADVAVDVIGKHPQMIAGALQAALIACLWQWGGWPWWLLREVAFLGLNYVMFVAWWGGLTLATNAKARQVVRAAATVVYAWLYGEEKRATQTTKELRLDDFKVGGVYNLPGDMEPQVLPEEWLQQKREERQRAAQEQAAAQSDSSSSHSSSSSRDDDDEPKKDK